MPTDLSKYRTPTTTAPAAPDLSKYRLSSQPQQQPGFFDRLRTGVSQAAKERLGNVIDIKAKSQRGEQSSASGLLQTVGQTAAFAARDVPETLIKEGIREVAPSAIPVIKTGLQKTVGAALATQPAQAAMREWDDFKRTNPTAAANLEALFNIGAVIPSGTAATVGARLGLKATTATAKASAKVAQGAGKLAKRTPATVGQILTNVRRENLEWLADPAKLQLNRRAMQELAEHPDQPYFSLAQRTADSINQAEQRAAEKLHVEKRFFETDNVNATFDVSARYPDIAVALRNFRDSGLILETTDGPRGKVLDFKVSTTPQSSFSRREVDALNELLGKIKASSAVNVDDLLALRKSFSTAYDAVPLGVNGNPRPYHAAVMALKTTAEEQIDKILPPRLKEAFAEYRVLQDMKDDIGNKVITGQGELKPTAEQFLANLGNINKGSVRASAEELKKLTGIDLQDEVRAIKVAQSVSSHFASTGSRTQDIFRGILATGVGTLSLGTPGILVGAAATSPKLAGNVALGVARARQAASPRVRSLADYLKNAQPGLSVKDVSGMTREKLDAMRDYLIEQLPKSSGKLNLDIEQEAADFVEYLKSTPTIAAGDVNRALEILRLQGKTGIVETLRKELGAVAPEYSRDTAGRFAPKTFKEALRAR